MPTLTQIIVSACTKKDQENMKRKTLLSLTPAISTVIGKCVGIYSRKLSALRTLNSIILSEGGISNVTMNRMAKLYDCTTHQSLLPKLNVIASRFNIDLNRWVSHDHQFSIVFDNVDIFIKPRMESSFKTNTMYHMVQAMAVKDRVRTAISDRSPPYINLDNIEPSDLLPSETDVSELSSLMVNEVLKVWSEIDCLKGVKLPLVSKQHRYSSEMRNRSSMVKSLNTL